jgi:hypothetical protein
VGIGPGLTQALITCQNLAMSATCPYQACVTIGDGIAIDGISLSGVCFGASGVSVQTLQNDQAGDEGVFHEVDFHGLMFIISGLR